MSALEPISVWQVSCITPTQSQLSSAKPLSADALSAAGRTNPDGSHHDAGRPANCFRPGVALLCGTPFSSCRSSSSARPVTN